MNSERNTIGVSNSTTSTAYDNNNPSLIGNPKKDVHYYFNVDYREEDDNNASNNTSTSRNIMLIDYAYALCNLVMCIFIITCFVHKANEKILY